MADRIVAANWKMNKLKREVDIFMDQFCKILRDLNYDNLEIVISPPYLYLERVISYRDINSCNFYLGAQDVSSFRGFGAYTGEISSKQLKDVGCKYVIVGHSERRQLLNEDESTVRAKIVSALEAELVPIVCVGETGEERKNGETEKVVSVQLDSVISVAKSNGYNSLVVAYEPVWAIGTGVTPTCEEIEKVHLFIKELLKDALGKEFPVLYGGSVKPENSGSLIEIANVDGFLVGGASLSVKSFIDIVNSVARR